MCGVDKGCLNNVLSFNNKQSFNNNIKSTGNCSGKCCTSIKKIRQTTNDAQDLNTVYRECNHGEQKHVHANQKSKKQTREKKNKNQDHEPDTYLSIISI